jgi:hypothetical protein
MAFVRSYSCPECGFELEDDGRLFYYDSDSNEIIEYLLLMSTVDLDNGSKIKGDVSETYCKTCDRYILVYSIREAEGDIEDLCETVMKGIEKHMSSCHEELKRMNDIKKRSEYTITREDDYYVVRIPEWEDFYYSSSLFPEMSREEVIEDDLNDFHEEFDEIFDDLAKRYDKQFNAIYLILDERGKLNDEPDRSEKVTCPKCECEVNRYAEPLDSCPRCGADMCMSGPILMD